jgi:cyclophilin family peptidyl-prolyl cis-trans isomerase
VSAAACRLVALLAVLLVGGCAPGAASPEALQPPRVTPLAVAPAEPAGSGVTGAIGTSKGDIVIELFDRSSPIAAANFIGLAEAGWYDGVVFHRLVPHFVIQGGDGLHGRAGAIDEERIGTGGPGYTIPDEAVVGAYARGIVAMARSSQPNSQGSQFFIVLEDRAGPILESRRTYAIFGRVASGMEAVDAIAAMPNSGEPNHRALEPVAMDRVAIRRP